MCDNDLRAMAVMLQEVSSIEEVDIGSNALLTEKALVPFLERLFCESAARDLHALVLNDLKHMGARSIETITRLLSDGTGLRSVRVLNLSHVSITMRCYQGLAKAVRHHESIETLNLCDTGLGSNPWMSKQCIVDILCCATLRNLDIGWNCFDVDFFVELGNNVIEKRRLETLSIANCSSQCLDTSRSNPSSFFFELIAQDKALTCLDASLNRMDFRAALVLEDSLTCHKSLKKLDISHNPLGTLGIRSAMRLLASQTSGLTNFEFAGCYDGTVANFQSINMTNPGGHYSLDMSKPYDRSILRILYKYCEKFQLLPENAFTQVSWKGGWSHAMKNSHGLYEVPTSGNLSFVFSLDQAIEQRIKGIADDDYSSFIDKHMEIAKTKPAFNKLVPLFSSWELQKGHSKDQLVWLNALAKDFVLTPGQLEHLCNVKHSAMRTDIVYHLLPCVIGGETAETLSMGLFPSIGEFLKTHRILRRYIDFNIENPTGHYRLSLDINTDYAIAEKLCLLDRWEVVLDHRHGRADLSQRGNRSHFRNEEYAERSLHSVVESIATWTLPETDVLEFDYVTSKRCPKDVAVLSDRLFSNILVAMFDAECNDVSKLQVLRMLSHLFYLTSTQMRELLSFFKDASYRADVFVNFYVRVVDMWNQKIFRVSFSSEAELTRARNRLGHALAFPFVQPENIQLRADFAQFDERLAANILLMIAAKECAGNIREPQYVDANGVVDPLTTGVPRRWETFADMPKDGIFTCSYVCAPENRNFNVRTSLAEQMATFRMDVQENEVEWWTGLNEVPPDVLDLLDWLLGNFEDVSKAFTLIDGVGGNGVISLREFEEGLTNLNCKKFEGKNGKLDYDRIATIFRYLDPGGEGSVSEGEWAILDQLWKEYQLCIAEFVHFIQRIFGDDIMDAWEFLDLDQSGELTMEEWLEGVESISYFGPAKCVFALIDNSDDGNISKDEFAILDKYKR
jgi:Ca2+-binding EF-hand superfamily protein/Ran GTPase-activating protein (RanGAP) involved in mRNA processing and transport